MLRLHILKENYILIMWRQRIIRNNRSAMCDMQDLSCTHDMKEQNLTPLKPKARINNTLDRVLSRRKYVSMIKTKRLRKCIELYQLLVDSIIRGI